MTKVYIVLVNFNNYNDTIECLESLLKSDYANYQILVVDNSADYESQKSFKDWVSGNSFPKIETSFGKLVLPLEPKPIDHKFISGTDFQELNNIVNEKIIFLKVDNNGFAAANNIAFRYLIKFAQSNAMVWVLNNDTVIEKNTLGNLIAGYQTNINCKLIFGSVLKYYDDPLVIQGVFGKYNKWFGMHYHIGNGEKSIGKYAGFIPGKNNYVIGASMFLPLQFIKQAGLMCEDYFLYFEELDWIKSSEKYGYKMYLVENAIVYHKEGSSTIKAGGKIKKDTSLAEFYSIIGRVRFIKKWYPVCLITVLPGVFFALGKRLFLGKFSLVFKTFTAVLIILFNKTTVKLRY